MTSDDPTTEIDQLKKDVLSDDWELVKSSAARLGKIGGDQIVDFLISLLASDKSGIRNRAALALEDIKDDRALEPLLTAIFKKENHNYNGTLVFALESLNCSGKLKEIFRILFYETHESKISAYAILSEQTFDFTEADLNAIQQMWDDCIECPDKCPGYEDMETRQMMQDAVDGFKSYLQSDPTDPRS
jgi:HEAT repeat protein